jgi:hypothetical protein
MFKLNNFLYKFTSECLETLSIVSYDLLMVIGLIALVLSIFGWKKGKEIGFICPAIYIIFQIIVKVLT